MSAKEDALAKLETMKPDGDRSWLIPTGMSMADKHDYGNRVARSMRESAPIVTMPIDEIRAVQSGVTREKVHRMIEGGVPDEPPIVVKRGGTLYLHDGHHRVIARRLLGEREVRVRLVEARGSLSRWAKR
jgi:hypothetical protein